MGFLRLVALFIRGSVACMCGSASPLVRACLLVAIHWRWLFYLLSPEKRKKRKTHTHTQHIHTTKSFTIHEHYLKSSNGLVERVCINCVVAKLVIEPIIIMSSVCVCSFDIRQCIKEGLTSINAYKL